MDVKNRVFCWFWENGCILYDTSSVAAWFQAIGAVAAIWGAFKISENQHKKALKIAREQRKFEIDRRFEICFALLQRARGLYKMILETRVPNQTSFEIPQSIIDELGSSFSSIPAFEYPSATTIVYIGWLPDHLRDLSRTWHQFAGRGQVSIKHIDDSQHPLGKMLREHLAWINDGIAAVGKDKEKMLSLIDNPGQG